MATTNYSFAKRALGHPVRDDDIGDNLDLIDSAIKAREDEIAAIHTEGASTFAGSGGQTITHNLNLATYSVSIESSADGSGAIGEVWVTDESLNSFIVRNSGSAVTAFTWTMHTRT